MSTTKGLTDQQLKQIDIVNNAAYEALCAIVGKRVKWDMEWIGKLSDDIVNAVQLLTGKSEMELYPYIGEKRRLL